MPSFHVHFLKHFPVNVGSVLLVPCLWKDRAVGTTSQELKPIRKFKKDFSWKNKFLSWRESWYLKEQLSIPSVVGSLPNNAPLSSCFLCAVLHQEDNGLKTVSSTVLHTQGRDSDQALQINLCAYMARILVWTQFHQLSTKDDKRISEFVNQWVIL